MVGPRPNAVCRRIALARSASGLTRQGLAQSLTACTGLEVSARDVGRFERSRVPWQLLDEIARLTGTSATWLLYGEESSADAPPGLAETAAGDTADANAAGDEVWRPSRGRIAAGLVFGFLIGVGIQAATHSTPAAVVAAITIALIAFLRSSPRGG
jgi:hypothetical protein